MDEIRIGVVGLGGICRTRHVPGFQKIDGVKLCAVANRTRASSERAAQEAGIPAVCDTWQEVIARDDINAVLIGTWPYLHCDISVAALEAGKHVFCQARMARNLKEAERMAAVARKSGLAAALCPVPIGLSIDRLLARLLRENAIGKVRYVTVSSFANTWVDPAAPLNWRKDHVLSGLNMHTLGMYIEVIHRWFGWISRVSAETFIYTSERPNAENVKVPVEIPDQMTLNTVVGADLPVHYVISTMSGSTGDTIGIYGEKCALHYDVNRDILYRLSEGNMEAMEPGEDERYDVDNWRVEQDFINAVRHGAPYHPDFEDGLRYMQVIQAAYDSAQSRKHITLNP